MSRRADEKKTPVSLITLLLSNYDFSLPLIWGELQPLIWFNVVFIFGAVCGFACCVHFLNLVHDIGKAKPACKPEISHNNAHI